jgi:hypothetical protein
MLSELRILWRRRFGKQPPEDAAFVISYPKCGRTWHKLMVGYYLARLTGAPDDQAFRVAAMCRRAGLPPLVYSHNDAGFKDGLKPSSRLVGSPQLWRGRDVLFLVRDPRDVLVSAYHHASSRSFHFAGSLGDFIRRPDTGIAKVMAAYRSWHDNAHLARRRRVHSYEEMHRDPAAVLRSSLEFFGLSECDEGLIADTVGFCSLGNMKRYEEKDLFRSKMMRNEAGLAEGAKAREGKVGAHLAALSSKDRAYIDAFIAKAGDPFAEYYRS